MKKPLVTAAAAMALCLGLGQASAEEMNLNPTGGASTSSSGATNAGRPTPTTVGIGLGSSVGNDLTIPNLASVRFVLTPTFILEPFVNLSFQKSSSEPNIGTTTSTSTTTLGVGAQGRFLLASRGPVDLNLLGSASIVHTGEDLIVDRSRQAVGISWGLGLSWFFSQYWSLSLDATNPFLQLARSSVDMGSTDTDWTLGVVFDPSVIVAIHAYL